MITMDLSTLYFGLTIVLICLLIQYLIKFYSNVNKYPSGPKPIPIFGNLLLLIKRREIHPYYAIQEIGENYDKLFTFWIGSKPVIIIIDVITGKEIFNKIDFAGRPNSTINHLFSGDGCDSFIFMNYGKELQILRKVSIETLRSILSGNKFPSLVNRTVDKIVNLIQTREKRGVFSPLKYAKFLFLNILAELIFDKTYEFDDKELSFIGNTYALFNAEGANMMLTDLFPITKYFLKSTVNSKLELNKLTNLLKTNFDLRSKHYKSGSCDNICDSIITARNKLMSEGKESSKYLTDSNMIGVINALFIAGSDTNSLTFNWILLLLAYYPDIQQKLRNEIQNKIGIREPNLSDKSELHYVNAIISEALRFRNINAMGVFHSNMNQTNIFGYSIPKNTMLFVHTHAILNDKNYWSEPEKFIPERFLDSNQMFITTRFPAYIPFSTGKRICVGEKIAFDMQFLVLTRLMQATNGYQLVIADDSKHSIDLIPQNRGFLAVPKPFKLFLKLNE